jgi:hypothetical protein
MLTQAVDLLKESGRFHPAAGYQKQIAEVYETDLVDLEKAMNAYEAAYVLNSRCCSNDDDNDDGRVV